ncbi:MAG: repressor LexA [Gemmatimonadetes bacterium]|jgi:repressor LexA|nr:repressor LexA [Gemmatimonadota bacterium]
MPQSLSKLERRILNYIVDYLRRNTYQPSIREIGKRFSIKSTKTVSEYLQALADKGHIERDPSRSRGVKLLGINLFPHVVDLPVQGRAAAGNGGYLSEQPTARLGVDRALVGSEEAFFLQAIGNSMEGVGIFDCDMVVVEPAELNDVANGEIVALTLGGEPLVKRLFRKGPEIVFEAANPDYAPILVHEDGDWALLGRVTGLFRQLGRKPATAGA